MNTRRHFLKTASATTLAAPWIGWQTTASGAPSGNLRFANFGAAGRAWGNLTEMLQAPNTSLVAVAEVDLVRTKQLNETHPGAKVFQDWRELLDKMHKEIDAVVIATPDHMHAPIAMAAMQLGKHVYCEKPLTRTIDEARRLRAFASEKGLMTQMGIQVASSPGNKTAVALLQAGIVGKVKAVHSSCPKSWGSMTALPAIDEAPPETLDWDKWIGVGKMRKFVPREFHPSNWRKRIGYGTGTLGDMGCHIYHTWFMGLGQPTTLEVTSHGPAPVDGDSWPLDGLVHHRMKGNAFTEGDFDFTWYDGVQRVPAEVIALLGSEEKNAEGKVIEKAPATGTLVIGTTGVLVIPHGGMPTIYRDGKKSDEVIEALEAGHHHKNFADAIRGDIAGKPLTNFDYSGPMTEAVLLGTVAMRLKGETLKWDEAAGKFIGSDAANAMIHEEYRSGWEVEGL